VDSASTSPVDLNTTAHAQAALLALTNAIAQVAGMRGMIGADINQVQAASNVATVETENLTSAESGVADANVAGAVADMTKYNILGAAGMAALQEANQAQQSILKLLQ
jgi:flagellin